MLTNYTMAPEDTDVGAADWFILSEDQPRRDAQQQRTALNHSAIQDIN
ncbi:hypothetical protein H7849_06975 [Alloacidobacterium dinghuense]|uniref:Uncharacterized protein n=1 Tax=Alloacidobacterium dinghuense TaxID=2763107 RepID=A0A7G8BM95_9BACT|nr:hypothetical protein [Alloacidobacterium dinghuense]QNI33665.1 hypothetical protein H7849_06975 [Alloacidobacterium dinghuense]